MTRPPASQRLTLVEDQRGGTVAAGPVPVRRYRLVRVRSVGATADPQRRFEYLKRSYD